MYLHIGKDIIIKKKDIIAILNIEKTTKTEDISNYIEKSRIINIDKNKKKSLILIEENHEIKAYISNISTTTLAKRNIL